VSLSRLLWEFSLKERLDSLHKSADESIASAATLGSLEEIRIQFLGKKGTVTELLKALGQMSAEERPKAGAAINELKNRISSLLEARKTEIEDRQSVSLPEGFDPTLPGRTLVLGGIHPLTRVQEDITRIFKGFGFSTALGPDVETDHYNFLALNFPPDHPARDAQDTFYITENLLLRTHTSPVQVRTMEGAPPPFKFIAPGRVYRHEAIDATHHHIFHQVEGFLVDEGVTFAHLKGVLGAFVGAFFGPDIRTRFRPSFFPFTEPSAEMDISCIFCGGKGCRMCKQSGWIEIMGCGMIDPAVLGHCRIDAERWTGFAFGMGVERLAILKYGVDDIRLFYQNDMRFLKQF
jgi:phenylalanyl-tRNA synthetase alpha chain